MTFDMGSDIDTADELVEDGARIIGPGDVRPPDDDVTDVIADARDRLVAMSLQPGDVITNDALCVLLRLPARAYRVGRERGWLQAVNGDEGLMLKLAEAGVPTKPGASRWTVLASDDARAYYRERGLRTALRALDRDRGFIATIRPESAEESKRINDDLARLGIARQMAAAAMDRRRNRERIAAFLRPKPKNDPKG